MNAAGRRRRHRANFVSAKVATNRISPNRRIVFQILESDNTPVFSHVGGDRPRNVPGIKTLRIFSNLSQSPRQIPLHQKLPRLVQNASTSKNLPRRPAFSAR